MTKLKQILIVDDSSRDTELALAALGEYRLANEIVVLGDGAEALDFLFRRGEFENREGDQPAVVLLDIKMPKVDGMEVLRQLKSDDRLRMIPIVMMTSSKEEQDLINSYRLGVNAYVVKPVNFQEFMEAVKNIGAFWGVFNEPPPVASTLHTLVSPFQP